MLGGAVTNDWTRASTDALAIFEERVLLRFIVLSAIAAVVVGFSFKDSGLRIGAAGSRRWRVCYCPVYRPEAMDPCRLVQEVAACFGSPVFDDQPRV